MIDSFQRYWWSKNPAIWFHKIIFFWIYKFCRVKAPLALLFYTNFSQIKAILQKKVPQPIFEPFLTVWPFLPKGNCPKKSCSVTLKPIWDSKTMLSFKANSKETSEKKQWTDEQILIHRTLTTAMGPRKELELKSYDIKHKYKNCASHKIWTHAFIKSKINFSV